MMIVSKQSELLITLVECMGLEPLPHFVYVLALENI